jgi:neutral ceramidase
MLRLRLHAASRPLPGLVLLALSAGASVPAEPGWQAGVARVEITPRAPMWLAGYAARKRPAEGTAQPLFAKALALQERPDRRLVVVTVDLIGITPALRHAVAVRAQRQFGLPPERLLLNASHTHSGPEYRVRPGREDEARAYTAFLEDKLTALIGAALEQFTPATLTWSEARCGFAMNRRPDHTLPPGHPHRGKVPNPRGPVDHAVPALAIAKPDGVLRAVLFGYACHNTCLSFYRYCGDYAGYAQHYLEEHRSGFTALFLAGCGGDQNPYPRGNDVVPGRTDLELAQFHGRTLANAVEVALVTHPSPVTGPLQVALATVPLAYAAPGRTAHAYPVQVVQFGAGLTLVALGSEVVVDYSLRLKLELAAPGRAIWVAGYSNDYSGYIPSRRVLQEGGYEAAEGWAETVESDIVAQVHALDRQTRGTPESVTRR